MSKLPITVIILTYNEEKNIKDCIKNVSGWADEIIIVDSYSTDKTLKIAEKYDAKIHQHKFTNQAEQFNWALDNIEISGDWVIRLDADEWLTEELKQEISNKLSGVESGVNGFLIKRRVYFMGRWIKHGAYYPTWLLRLFRNGTAKSELRAMDEHLILIEGKSEKLKYDFVDENRKSLSWWVEKHNDYASREAKAYIQESKKARKQGNKLGGGQVERKRWFKENFYYKLPPFFRAVLYWKYRYFIRLGFLDGIPGLIFHFLQGFWYRFLVDAKIYEYKNTKIKENDK